MIYYLEEVDRRQVRTSHKLAFCLSIATIAMAVVVVYVLSGMDVRYNKAVTDSVIESALQLNVEDQ